MYDVGHTIFQIFERFLNNADVDLGDINRFHKSVLLQDNDQRMRKSIQSIGATSSGTSVGSGVGSRHELEVNWKHDLMKVHNLAAIIGALIVGIILSHLLF